MLDDRFWSKVQVGDGCWVWVGARRRDGYGLFWNPVSKRWNRAHRVAFEDAIGPIPRGLFLLHHCDNPPCVNPAHLSVGTQRDNLADMTDKGRRSRSVGRPQRGELNRNRKLTDDAVREIRRLRAEGLLHREIAGRLGVHKATVGCVLRGQTWLHVR